MVIGGTGSSGSGKSLLGKMLKSHGFCVINADETVHKIYNEDKSCIKEIADRFGSEVVFQNGQINRNELGKIVFADKREKEALERIIFPRVLDVLEKMITKAGSKDVFLDAPTLFESGADRLCDFTIAVLAEENIRLERIKKRDGITETQAKLRLKAQPDDSFYIASADKLLYNNGNEADFLKEAENLIRAIKEEGGNEWKRKLKET